MAELAKQPFGEVLVWAVAVGLYLLVVWRLLEAAFGHRDEEGADRVRKRLISAGKAVIYGALAGHRDQGGDRLDGGSSGSGSTDTMTAKVMDLPAGQWIVAAVGLAIIGYAVNLAWRGWTEKFAEHLDTEGKLGYSGAAYLLLGKVGHIAKGIALGHRRRALRVRRRHPRAGQVRWPRRGAARSCCSSPSGPYLLIAIGVGIACYGLFCFARARHLDTVTGAATGSPAPSPASGRAAASASWSAGGSDSPFGAFADVMVARTGRHPGVAGARRERRRVRVHDLPLRPRRDRPGAGDA